mgnify:CR=1 FL=1
MISRGARILGLDIGTHSVKAVELARSGDRYSVTGYAQAEIAANGTLKDAITAVLRDGRFKSKQVVSSVSGRSVIVRYINTPHMKTDDLKASMKFEADKYIPFDVNEVILDCVPLDDKPSAETGDMRVVLVAVKKDVVDEHVRLLQEAGLYPYIIDVDCFALGNAFENSDQTLAVAEPLAEQEAAGDSEDADAGDDGQEVVEAEAPVSTIDPEEVAEEVKAEITDFLEENDDDAESEAVEAGEEPTGPSVTLASAIPDLEAPQEPAGEAPGETEAKKPDAMPKVYALVDMGAQKTNINIVSGTNSYFTREVYIGGEDMSEAISKHLGVTPEEAEQIKRSGEREVEVIEAIAQTIDDLANEVFLSFDYFENQFDTEIKTVYISGGGSRLKGLQGVLAQTLGRDVRTWDPVAGMDVSLSSAQAAKLRESAPQLAVAMGLASRLRTV